MDTLGAARDKSRALDAVKRGVSNPPCRMPRTQVTEPRKRTTLAGFLPDRVGLKGLHPIDGFTTTSSLILVTILKPST